MQDDTQPTAEQTALTDQLERALVGRQVHKQKPLPGPAQPAVARDTPGGAIISNLLTMPDGQCMYCGDPAELVCDECNARVERENQELAAKEERRKQAARREWFNDKIPEIYRNTDELLLPRWSKEIIGAWNPQDRYGVTIVGPSGSSKTRTAIKLLEKAYLGGTIVEYRQAGDFRREINRAARGDNGEDSKLLRELGEVPLLVLDDLGNQAWTPASEEFFLALFEARMGNRLKTIITSQYPSDEFVAKTSGRAGQAIARRIGPEFAWVINTHAGTVNPPTTPTNRLND